MRPLFFVRFSLSDYFHLTMLTESGFHAQLN